MREQSIEELNRECLEKIEYCKKRMNKNKLIYQINIEKRKKGDEIPICDRLYVSQRKRCSKNYVKAADWYKKAAEHKNTKALNNLAYLYQKEKV